MMLIRTRSSDYFHQFGQKCARCHSQILELPFISWQFQTVNVAFHPECANKVLLGLALDLHAASTKK